MDVGMTTYLLNSPVLTDYGRFGFRLIKLDEAREQLRGGFESAVGHPAAAELLTSLLRIPVPLDRRKIVMQPGDRAVVLRLTSPERLAPGGTLSPAELAQVPYELGLLVREGAATSSLPESAPSVFVSYRRKNAAEVDHLVRLLEAEGIQPWIDREGIRNGEDFEQRIVTEIERAAAFVVVWSRDAAESEWVRKEIVCALEIRGRRPLELIPICLDETPLPEKLKTIEAVMPGEEWRGQMIRQLDQHRRRRFFPFDPGRPLGGQGEPLRLPSGRTVDRVRCFESVHCRGELLADAPATSLAAVLASPQVRLAVFVQATGKVDDLKGIDQVFDALQATAANNSDRPNVPRLLLHVTGPIKNGDLTLAAGQTGEWLDLVKSATQAIGRLVKREATILLFTAVPVPVGILLGQQCDRYWKLELFHYDRGGGYALVAETRELPVD